MSEGVVSFCYFGLDQPLRHGTAALPQGHSDVFLAIGVDDIDYYSIKDFFAKMVDDL